MYAPAIGRFCQPDPIGYADGMNIYAYCGNNPLNYVDPWGLSKTYGEHWLELLGDESMTQGKSDELSMIAAMYIEFRTGLGPAKRNFKGGSIQVAGMKTARGVKKARRDFYAGNGDALVNGFKWREFTRDGGPLTTNLTRQYVGSYHIKLKPDYENSTLSFIIKNRTDMASYTKHNKWIGWLTGQKQKESWERSENGPGGTIRQTFSWTEPMGSMNSSSKGSE